MGTLKTTLKVESIDLFPTPVSFTKVNDNAIVLGASTFATLQLAAGLNTISTIPAGNAFLYVSAPASNSGAVEISLPGGGIAGEVLEFDQSSISQGSNYYGLTIGGPVTNLFNLTYTPGPELYGQGPANYGPVYKLDAVSQVSTTTGVPNGINIVVPTSNSAIGSGAELYVEGQAGVVNFIFIKEAGTGYLPGDTFTITPVMLGAVGGNTTINVEYTGTGVIIPVNQFGGFITTIGSGTSLFVNVFIGSDLNGSHKPIAVIPASNGAGLDYVAGDTVTISGLAFGLATPLNDVTVEVGTVGRGTRVVVAPVNVTGGSGTGLGVIANIGYTSQFLQQVIGIEVDPANPGVGYQIGDQITIDGTALGVTFPSPPTTDMTIDILGVTTPSTPVFSTVEPGDTGFFPIGDGTGYTLQASPAVPGDSIQYFVGTR